MTIFNVEGEEVTLDALVKFCFIKCNAVFALYGRLCSSAQFLSGQLGLI